MTSILLTKHDGTIVEFPVAELAQALAHRVAGGNTRCQGQSGVTLLSAGGTGLLLVDTSWHIGRRLVETYTVVSEASFPYGVAFQQGGSMFTLAQALAGAGYAGAVTDLASVFMAQYTTTGGALTYIAPSNLVLDEGSFQTRPAKIRRIAADTIYIQATEGEDDVLMEAGPTLLAMHEGLELAQADVAGLEASLTSKVDAETFEAAVAALVAADSTKADQAALDATDAVVATKADQAALDATNAVVATKQPQLGVGFVAGGHPLLEDGAIKAILGTAPVQVTAAATHVEVAMDQSYFDALSATDQALDALTAEVTGKQPQLGVGSVEGGHPLLEDGAIKAILGTTPVQVTASATHVEVAMDQSYFDALTATGQALASKADQAALDVEIARLDEVAAKAAHNAMNIVTLQGATASLFESVGGLDTRVTTNTAANGALQSAINSTDLALAALTVEVDGKQDQLTAGTVQGGFQMLQDGLVRAIKGISPVQVPVDTRHVEVYLDQTALASTAALAALETEVDGKQPLLSAGTGFVFHEKLLEANTIKSLTAGNNVTLTSTGEFVSISAEGGGATSAEGPAGTLSLVNAEGEIRRIRPGAGAYAVDQGASVEVGVQLQAAQFQAPFAVMDQANATALRARLGETKAEFFTNVEVNGAADVSGIFSAGQLRSEGLVQVGVNPPAGATVAVDGTLRAKGNISTTAALRADGVEPLTGSAVNVAGALAVTDDLTTTGTTRCDTFKGRVANQVTCQDNLTVEGLLVCQDGLAVVQGVTAQSIFCQGNLSVLGNVTGWSPFWVAGLVNGTTVSVEYTSPGTRAFTIFRASGKPTGIFDITMPAHPSGASYVVQLTSYQNGQVRVWEIIPLTSTGFTFNMTGWSGSPQNGRAFVAVLR
jgi:hypothetical protein